MRKKKRRATREAEEQTGTSLTSYSALLVADGSGWSISIFYITRAYLYIFGRKIHIYPATSLF